MDHDSVLARFDRQVRREARPDGPCARVERMDEIVRQCGGEDDWNGVLWSRLDADGADAAIAEQVRHFASLGRGFEWKLYAHDAPADLGERLSAAGFVAEPAEALMIAAIADLSTAVVLPDGVRLIPGTGPEEVELMVQAHDQAFGTDGGRLRRRMLIQLAERPDMTVAVVAMAGGAPVSSARMEMSPGTDFAGLWGGGTVAAWRGRGIYRALVAYRARIAAERGYRYLQVDASDDSRPVLQRLGFAHLSTTTPYVHRARRVRETARRVENGEARR